LRPPIPRSFIGVDHWLGPLARGHRADIVAIDAQSVEVVASWIGGAGCPD
jgi:N-acetylglucosamine-6-phosphate deacetylase